MKFFPIFITISTAPCFLFGAPLLAASDKVWRKNYIVHRENLIFPDEVCGALILELDCNNLKSGIQVQSTSDGSVSLSFVPDNDSPKKIENCVGVPKNCLINCYSGHVIAKDRQPRANSEIRMRVNVHIATNKEDGSFIFCADYSRTGSVPSDEHKLWKIYIDTEQSTAPKDAIPNN